MPTQALIIDEPWIGHIMAGQKTWEMRSRRTTKRGPVALVRKGSGHIVAITTIIDCLPALTAAQMAAVFDKHRIPQASVEQASYKWFVPWVLGNIRVLDKPVPYHHPSGAVTWVDLTPQVQAALSAAGGRAPTGGSSASGRSIAPVQLLRPGDAATSRRVAASSPANTTGDAESNLAIARRVLDDPRAGSHAVDVPVDAVTVKRRGSRLYIDAVWNDGQPDPPRSATGWVDAIGVFSALGAMLCMATLLIMMVVGFATWSMTFFHAFYAVPPMFGFMLIATLTGHSHLLPDFNEEHDRRGNPR